ncbi:MAG: SPASM domain-containing protein [Planctomycetota bacterium]
MTDIRSLEKSTTMRSLFGGGPVEEALSPDEKAELESASGEARDRDLWDQELVFASRPHTVYLQLSNFCNMSCIMCYDGSNPPLRKMPEDLVVKTADSFLREASVVLPFVGSEPLVLTWETARRLAQRYRVELDIITNVQFLDERMFHELEPWVGRITFSIDSHVPEVFEKIRLGANANKVFRNLPVAARLCREHGIEAVLNIVLMSENASMMPETIAYMADLGIPTLHVLEYLDQVPGRELLDPTRCFRPEYIDSIRQRCVEVAEEKRVLLIWEPGGNQVFDFRRGDDEFRTSKARDPFVWRLRYYLPGYCVQSVYSLKVEADGTVYPCCMAEGGQLALGNLKRRSAEEIWNGPEARELRRRMLTGEVPEICRSCAPSADRVGPRSELPFVWKVYSKLGCVPSDRGLEIEGPGHMTRHETPPTIRWRKPDRTVSRYLLVMALGGESMHVEELAIDGKATEFTLPSDCWQRLKGNFGYWWTLIGVNDKDPSKSLRSAKIHCMIRHQPIPAG